MDCALLVGSSASIVQVDITHSLSAIVIVAAGTLHMGSVCRDWHQLLHYNIHALMSEVYAFAAYAGYSLEWSFIYPCASRRVVCLYCLTTEKDCHLPCHFNIQPAVDPRRGGQAAPHG